MVVRFGPDSTITTRQSEREPQTHRTHTMIQTGTYKLTGKSLTITVTQVTVDGKAIPAPAKQVVVYEVTFSNVDSGGWKTLTINTKPTMVLTRQ